MQETVMPTQDYYDLLVKSAYDGTFPSIDPDAKRCKYRVPGTNKKCAVGLLIPDDKYCERMENTNCLETIVNEKMIKVEGFDNRQSWTENSYRQVQKVHDNTALVGWVAEDFINEINKLSCFEGIKKVNPRDILL